MMYIHESVMKELVFQYAYFTITNELGVYILIFISAQISFKKPLHTISLPTAIANPFTQKEVFAIHPVRLVRFTIAF